MFEIYICTVLIVLYFVLTEGLEQRKSLSDYADYLYIFLFGLVPVFNFVLIYFIACHRYEVWKGKA